MRTFSLFALLAIASLFSFTRLSAQCIPQMNISVYSDGDVSDDGSTVYGYSSSVDNSTLCSCYHSNYLSASWLVLPDGSYVEGWQPGDTSSVSTPTDGVEGSYYATGAESLDCSCYGNFGVAGPGFPILPPPPNITGISDTSTWSNTIYQGGSGYLAVFGTGLTAWGETPTPAVTGDSGLTLGSVSYASDVQVNVAYTVAANAAIAQHTITLQTKQGNSQGTARVAQAAICMGGTNITGSPENAVVGQQIVLQVQAPCGTAASFSNPQWTISGGGPVGGFSPTLAGNGVLPVTTNATSLTFYFATAGQFTVSFSFSGAGSSLSTTFTAQKPNPMIGVGQQPYTAIVVDSACGYLALHYGGCPGYTAGISFTVTGDPNLGGSYEWIQVVVSANAAANGTSVLNCSNGIDTTLPYSTAAATIDSPLVHVSNGNTEYTANESFQMFLLYQPSSANAIFIPLAVIPWGWTADVTTQNGWSTSAFNARTISGGSPFQTGGTYPSWSTQCGSQ